MKISRCTVHGVDTDTLFPYSTVEIPPDTKEIRVGVVERYGDTEIIVAFVPEEEADE